MTAPSAWRLAAMVGAVMLLSFGPAAAGLAQDRLEHLSPLDVFALAEEARSSGRTADALALYDALTRDPDLEVRNEARFRKGRLLASTGRNAEAAVLYRAILDETPGATPVRLELARTLVQLGDEAGARRALRQAQAAGLPPDIATVVDQFAAALRSTRRAGGSFEFGLAPDTNINRATNARTLDTVIAPLTLSDDARAQSGVGLEVSAQAYVRLPLTNALSVLSRISGRGLLYHGSEFDDISSSTLIGVEWASGRDRLTPSLGRTWRWFGGDLYATTDAATLTWLHPMGQRAQLTMSGSVAHADYRKNPLQSGGLYDLSANGEHALSPRAGIGATIGVTRQAARDPGYATVAGSLGLLGWRDFGRATVFASAMVRRTEGDARLFLFPERRKDWLSQASAGTTLRWLSISGFAPVVRFTLERNASSVGLYDYRRFSTELAITRAW